MLQDPGDDRAGARPDPDLAPPRAHRRPRHQRRRGRHLHGLGQGRPASRRRSDSLTRCAGGRRRGLVRRPPPRRCADRARPGSAAASSAPLEPDFHDISGIDTMCRFGAARAALRRTAGGQPVDPRMAAVLQRALQDGGSRALALGGLPRAGHDPADAPPAPPSRTTTRTTNRRERMADTLTITDNRTGKQYEIPIQDGTIRAMDLRQIKVDAGRLRHDDLRPGVHEHRGVPQPDHVSSTATRASSSTAATRSSSWRSTATSSRPPT